MKIWISGVCLAILCFSCNNAKPFYYSQTIEYSVPESNIAFVLPQEYLQMTVPEYQILLDSSDYSDEVKLNQNRVLSKMEARFPNFDLLVDSLTYENLIMIFRTGPHIELDRRTSNLAVKMYTENNSKNNLIVYEETLIENQLMYMGWFRYIKLKLKQDYIKGKRTISHYLISTNTHTFAISFLNVNGDDFQEYVNRIKKIE